MTLPTTTTPTTALSLTRAPQRGDRRRRREAKLDAMRQTLTALERAMPVALTLVANDDDDGVRWEGFLDAKAMRVRRLMQQSIQLAQEAKRLEGLRTTLQHLLREQRVAARVLTGLLLDRPTDASNMQFDRWSELSRRVFRPWTIEQCQDEINAALKKANAFQRRTDTTNTGASAFGWQSEMRVDDVRGVFQIQSQKSFRGFDMMKYVDVGWRAYTDPATHREVILGHRVVGHLETLQTLEPQMVIVRSVERFSTIEVDAHLVNLVFRVKTESGYTQCVRSICCPELMRAMDGPRDTWPTNFIWLHWERVGGDDDEAFDVRVGGTLIGRDFRYARHWMMEALGCLLRSERLATGKQLLGET